MSEYLTRKEADMLIFKAGLEGKPLPMLEVDYGDGFGPMPMRSKTILIVAPETNSAKIRIKQQWPRVIDGVTMPMHVVPGAIVPGTAYYCPDFYSPVGYALTSNAATMERYASQGLLFYHPEEARKVTQALAKVGFE